MHENDDKAPTDDKDLDARVERLKREEREAREDLGDDVAGDWSGEAEGADEAGQ